MHRDDEAGRMTPQPVDIITVPWDSGRRDWRMGAGPAALLELGLARTIGAWDHDIRFVVVDADAGGPTEIVAATMALLRTTSHAVRAARAAGRLPLVLAGNCITTVGGVAGLDGADVAVAWLDAHGDLNTPATSPSGFLDGMAAATLLGWCHTTEAAAALDDFHPLPVQRFLLIGARALDPGEVEATTSQAVRVLSPDDVASEGSLAHALDELMGAGDDLVAEQAPDERLAGEHVGSERARKPALAGRPTASGVWLHVDLDALDPEPLAPANTFTPPGGLSLYHAIRVVQEAAARRPVAGMTLSSYDPACDPDGLMRAAVLPLVAEALGVDDSASARGVHPGVAPGASER
jgi:arginase